MEVKIHEELRGILRVGLLTVTGMQPPEDGGEALFESILATAERLKKQHQGLTVGQIPGTQETRKLYRAIGIDPTKNRPSSEALLRRIIKGKSLYRIHPLVDIFNLVSLSYQLSVGLYDESKIRGSQIAVRKGEPGWGFDGIRKNRVNVAGRLCVVDEEGPFGSPTSDSLRTSIEGNVDRALAVFFQHTDGEKDRLRQAVDKAAELCQHHLQASLEPTSVVEN